MTTPHSEIQKAREASKKDSFAAPLLLTADQVNLVTLLHGWVKYWQSHPIEIIVIIIALISLVISLVFGLLPVGLEVVKLQAENTALHAVLDYDRDHEHRISTLESLLKKK